MATYISKIKAYVDGDVDFLNDVVVQNDGTGSRIVQWNLDSPTKPTDAQLDALETGAAAIDNEISLVGLRSARNVKLAESDWTQMADSSLTDSVKAEWVTYRTALKDITDSATSLDDVTWPEKP